MTLINESKDFQTLFFFWLFPMHCSVTRLNKLKHKIKLETKHLPKLNTVSNS